MGKFSWEIICACGLDIWVFSDSRQPIPASISSPALEMMARVGALSGTSGLFESARETHFHPEGQFPEHVHGQKGCLEVSFQHCALTGATLAFLFRGEERPYCLYRVFPMELPILN